MSKFCMKCGAMLEDDAVFCDECGARQENQVSDIQTMQGHKNNGAAENLPVLVLHHLYVVY